MGLLAVLTYGFTGSIVVPAMLHSLNNSPALVNGLRQPDIHLAQPWIKVLVWPGR